MASSKNNETPLSAGKLPAELLGRLLERNAALSERLVIPPRVGEDAAVIALEDSDRYLVVGTDPITFVTEDLGFYVVTINANDVATLGARPLFFSCVLLFPEGFASSGVERVFSEIRRACVDAGIAWVGGHTEITPAVAHPVAVGQMIGEVSREGLVRKDRMEVGDKLLLTKALAVEAVSIIARERADEVRSAHGEAFLERATGFLHRPGISVVAEALAACSAGGLELHAMHDPTEGGLSGGLYELAAASGKGLRIDRDRVPVYPEARALCQQFGLDPLGVIASGSLLLAAAAGAADRIGEALRRRGVDCTQIGEVVAEEGCTYADGTELPRFSADEITKLF